MKKLLLIALVLMPTTADAHARKKSEDTKIREINFSMTKALECTKLDKFEKCLSDIFGTDIGYEIVEKTKLREVTFPRAYNVDFMINGVRFGSMTWPKIKFVPEMDFYMVCGLSKPLRIGTYDLVGSAGSCICGFGNKGQFTRKLEPDFSFIPEKTKLLTTDIRCVDERYFSSSLVKLLQTTTMCGYSFAKGTEFYDTVEGVEFVAPADGSIDMGDGTNLGVWKGAKYVNQATKEQPCKWRNATPDPPQNPEEE